MRFATRAVRIGQPPDPATGSVIVPIYQTVNFVFDDIGRPHGYEYSRSANPTRTALEQCLASLEEARFGLAFSSGMAAADAVLSLLRPGDHVVASKHLYGGTIRIFEKVYAPRGVAFTYVDGACPAAFADAVRDNTRMLWIETPANPLLQLVDVARLRQSGKPKESASWPTTRLPRPISNGRLRKGRTS